MTTIGVNQYQGVGAALKQMMEKEGWRGFFKGNGTNVIRIAPYSAIQFLSYEKFKKVCVPSSHFHPFSFSSTPCPLVLLIIFFIFRSLLSSIILLCCCLVFGSRRSCAYDPSTESCCRRDGWCFISTLYIPTGSNTVTTYYSDNRD